MLTNLITIVRYLSWTPQRSSYFASAGFSVRDRRVESSRPQPLRSATTAPTFATADLFSAAALTFSAAALTFSAAADPTPRVRGTLHFAPAAASIRPNCHPSPDIPPSIVSLFFVSLCGHRTDAFGHTGDLVCSFRQSRSPLLLTSFPSSVKRSRAVCVASRHALCSDADPTMKRDT